jgi:hypothetical protein
MKEKYFIIECVYKDNLIENIVNELYKYKSLMEIIE